MGCTYKKTWSKQWCCSADKRLTPCGKQAVHLIIENTAAVSYSRLWQNEVMFHTHSVYNPFPDSGTRWLTPARLEQCVWHWHTVITQSDNNLKVCLIIYSNREMAFQIQRKFTTHVLRRIFIVLESKVGNSSVGGRHLIVVRVDASWLKQCCKVAELFDVTTGDQLKQLWFPWREHLQSQQKRLQHHHCSWIVQKTRHSVTIHDPRLAHTSIVAWLVKDVSWALLIHRIVPI